MPTGPKGEKGPAYAVARAVKVAKIATGEIEEDKPEEEPRARTRPLSLWASGAAERAPSS